MIVYLLMNRKREFWKYLGAAAACSAGTLAVCWAVSSAHNGRLASYLISAFTDLFRYGIYDGLLYWTTLWLAVVCALISAYRLMRSFVLRQAETKALLVKNRLILDDYHVCLLYTSNRLVECIFPLGQQTFIIPVILKNHP